ncbi:leucyl/phenylalanyl-tRNA--protein transferase [Xanthomonas translucens]|uniref:leucyl/phenylalanyl-tRNA--protein transferase n=1 Tax=Xanthomonas campestris pv. translucens TaxID=343 RepID=UPI0002A7A5E4|nr:leucyl/phenylalanyl-tRNA--protein transferase [Xanthomonas translucens]AKK67807.1 leucyl/phenylalanyl-tRNA--protein transferase [Xanthomonas translucens pv. undulosa]AVY66763.1 leucyl/phenylalanyl-tRNA--protein transferase [Xanthomonas translucens pv. undulosa]ELQ15371.1 leucyl/phenylalanyl-tRNA--protein transferase [Xanthomonas translucens DAR61454]MBC3971474.1 leucyl/phenylalanyl-tRNA--protein transferase [Xanthomonas translucens pv. undulosa]MCT8271147.1 leucyl/phenylalanyl-tRNA--protein
MRRLPALLPADPAAPFPPASSALREPDGLLAIGGDLTPTRLLNAYAHGIFPWYSDGDPILWWSPDPRTVFRSDAVRLSSRFRRALRHSPWRVRADTAFAQVIGACAQAPRRGQDGTWITAEMTAAYVALHRAGHAHSVEVFDGEELVGGIYGVARGRMFFGESMFSARSGGSKVALAALAWRLHAWGWPLIDAQVENAHLLSLGAQRWPRAVFLEAIASLVADVAPAGPWTARFGELAATELAGR